MNSRIAKINAIGDATREKENDAAIAEYNRVCALENKVKALKPRIMEMMDVAQALATNKIPLGKEYSQIIGTNNEFVTDGIDHLLGFRVDKAKAVKMFTNLGAPIIGFGIKGGGYCGGDLFFDRYGNLVAGGVEHANQFKKVEASKMQSMLSGFDNFERKFYDYVDAL